MARIRSIHPGLYTTEAYMELSMTGRELLKALWAESDDHGIFQWSPLTIKARYMPADNVDIHAVLGELHAHWIKKFTVGGKAYGACRNFMKWQHPKKPTYPNPFPDELRTYVGLKPDGEQASDEQDGTIDQPLDDERDEVGKGFPTTGVKSPQREEEVKKEEDREEDLNPKKYHFEGSVIRLTPVDYQNWTKAYFSIPDLDAELSRIDDSFRGAKPKNWFSAASAMLAAKHQKLLPEYEARTSSRFRFRESTAAI